MAGFKLTPAAKRDLLNIGRYTKKQWGVKQRNKYLAQIDRRLHWLAVNPTLGKHRPDIKEGYYCFPEGMHIIFYIKRKKRIEIIGIVHQRLDVEKHFDC